VTAWTRHQLRGAIQVARLIDTQGNARIDIDGAYRIAHTSGVHPSDDLRRAETLLLEAGLLELLDGQVRPTSALAELALVEDLEASVDLLAERLQMLGWDDARVELGADGERALVEECRSELEGLGRSDLAGEVAQVSLVSDSLGYDILAPRLTGRPRLLEAKARRRPNTSEVFRFFVSRNEVQTGRVSPDDWFLVVCLLPAADQGDLRPDFGWCRVETIEAYLPNDGPGRWEQARVDLPMHLMVPGVPPAL